MVQIRKGKMKTSVTLQAYKNFYKNAGWSIDGEQNEKIISTGAAAENTETDGVIESAGDEWDEALNDEKATKPVSEMNRAELEALAAELGVNLDGMTKTSQMRDAIRAAM